MYGWMERRIDGGEIGNAYFCDLAHASEIWPFLFFLCSPKRKPWVWLDCTFAYVGLKVGGWRVEGCLFNNQMSKVNAWQPSHMMLRSLQAERLKTWLRLFPRLGPHKSPVTLDGVTGCSPRQVMCQAPRWQPPAVRRPLAVLDKLDGTSLPNFLPRGFTVKMSIFSSWEGVLWLWHGVSVI